MSSSISEDDWNRICWYLENHYDISIPKDEFSPSYRVCFAPDGRQCMELKATDLRTGQEYLLTTGYDSAPTSKNAGLNWAFDQVKLIVNLFMSIHTPSWIEELKL
ncbi:MAG: hypothetical protein UY48_C0045G0005 [Candidatus Gottesmanbacteria bacterium GW2011_GWB1_49_7]|uniref:Uncharacterized protein n=1 Tax=Candidatus Gottesmanbacteria bacterium GW2011_GWB1_49_7 TaxID=1618448 RepID=A0A0G1YV22_9BACT|nr:MAG: hypothetical protein UY48_C0045G0005 [Candidatus Gottesmanbacteria bacterium GW2011_GWB1_49_7]